MHHVGILTLHSGFNEGAILQAYCLASSLAGALPESRVEIIDQRYPSKIRIHGVPGNKRTQALQDFIDRRLPLSAERFVTHSRRRAFRYVLSRCNAVITGSDELWKLHYEKACLGLLRRQKDPYCPAFPNVYWFESGNKIPVIAYAPSIGMTDWRSIPRRHVHRMRRCLEQYALLSYRDERTHDFLAWLDPGLADRAEWVPDPTFAVDVLAHVERERLKRKLQRVGVDFSGPRVCTLVRQRTPWLTRFTWSLKKKGYQVISLSYANPAADVDLSREDLSPLEWMAVPGLMDFCIAGVMHGCIACILNDTPFIAIDPYLNAMGQPSKIRSLIGHFHLQDFYLESRAESELLLPVRWQALKAGGWPSGIVADVRASFMRRSAEYRCKIQDLLKRQN